MLDDYERNVLRTFLSFLLILDSILNGTSYAFIKDLGYEIIAYDVQTKSVKNSGTEFTVPEFQRMFIDIVSTISNYHSWTIRPYMCMNTDTNSHKFYTSWALCDSSAQVTYVAPLPTLMYAGFLSDIKVVSSTSITLFSGSNASSNVTVFFYIVE